MNKIKLQITIGLAVVIASLSNCATSRMYKYPYAKVVIHISRMYDINNFPKYHIPNGVKKKLISNNLIVPDLKYYRIKGIKFRPTIKKSEMEKGKTFFIKTSSIGFISGEYMYMVIIKIQNNKTKVALKCYKSGCLYDSRDYKSERDRLCEITSQLRFFGLQ